MTDELNKTIENHKKMWIYIKEQEKECDYKPNLDMRYALKSEYIYLNKIEDEPYNRCFLCDYAKKMQMKDGRTAPMCEYCPCLWGSEDISKGVYCQCSESGYVNWITSCTEDIINLPIKPELL